LIEPLFYKMECRGFDSRSITLIFHYHNASGRPTVDSVSNRNEYQKYFLGVKAAVVYGCQRYQLHVSTVLKSRSLKLLKSSGPLQGLFTFIYHRN